MAKDSDRIVVIDPEKQKDILSYLPRVCGVLFLAGLTAYGLLGFIPLIGNWIVNLLK